MKKSIEKNAQTNNAENIIQKNKKHDDYYRNLNIMLKKKYHWHINSQDSEKARMCFQSQCMNMKIIKICLEEYQIMIKKIKMKFALEI